MRWTDPRPSKKSYRLLTAIRNFKTGFRAINNDDSSINSNNNDDDNNGVRASVVFKELYYKPAGGGFETS
jgi:hypothetical protein